MQYLVRMAKVGADDEMIVDNIKDAFYPRRANGNKVHHADFRVRHAREQKQLSEHLRQKRRLRAHDVNQQLLRDTRLVRGLSNVPQRLVIACDGVPCHFADCSILFALSDFTSNGFAHFAIHFVTLPLLHSFTYTRNGT